MNEFLKENSNCAATYATFRLIGDQLDPQHVSTALRCTPSFVSTKGETFTSKAGTAKRQTGIWSLSSEQKIRSTSLERHLLYLLGQLDGKESVIHSFIVSGVRADFACYWESAGFLGGPVLSPDVLHRISQFGAGLNIDFFAGETPLGEPDSVSTDLR